MDWGWLDVNGRFIKILVLMAGRNKQTKQIESIVHHQKSETCSSIPVLCIVLVRKYDATTQISAAWSDTGLVGRGFAGCAFAVGWLVVGGWLDLRLWARWTGWKKTAY
jgi:hypothetical protein